MCSGGRSATDNFSIMRTGALWMLVLCVAQVGAAGSDGVATIEPSTGKLQPVGPIEYRAFEGNRRRQLAPFQLCLLCRCCATAAAAASCATMPCCFGIDCQLPNKPFGVCAFVPKTCNCASCSAV